MDQLSFQRSVHCFLDCIDVSGREDLTEDLDPVDDMLVSDPARVICDGVFEGVLVFESGGVKSCRRFAVFG